MSPDLASKKKVDGRPLRGRNGGLVVSGVPSGALMVMFIVSEGLEELTKDKPVRK